MDTFYYQFLRSITGNDFRLTQKPPVSDIALFCSSFVNLMKSSSYLNYYRKDKADYVNIAQNPNRVTRHITEAVISKSFNIYKRDWNVDPNFSTPQAYSLIYREMVKAAREEKDAKYRLNWKLLLVTNWWSWVFTLGLIMVMVGDVLPDPILVMLTVVAVGGWVWAYMRSLVLTVTPTGKSQLLAHAVNQK